jgi:hypothetical protein
MLCRCFGIVYSSYQAWVKRLEQAPYNCVERRMKISVKKSLTSMRSINFNITGESFARYVPQQIPEKVSGSDENPVAESSCRQKMHGPPRLRLSLFGNSEPLMFLDDRHRDIHFQGSQTPALSSPQHDKDSGQVDSVQSSVSCQTSHVRNTRASFLKVQCDICGSSFGYLFPRIERYLQSTCKLPRLLFKIGRFPEPKVPQNGAHTFQPRGKPRADLVSIPSYVCAGASFPGHNLSPFQSRFDHVLFLRQKHFMMEMKQPCCGLRKVAVSK